MKSIPIYSLANCTHLTTETARTFDLTLRRPSDLTEAVVSGDRIRPSSVVNSGLISFQRYSKFQPNVRELSVIYIQEVSKIARAFEKKKGKKINE